MGASPLQIAAPAAARPSHGRGAAHRNRGVGKRLLSALFDLARTLGCAEAWVLTDRANVSAMRLYASAGGVPSEQVMFTFKQD